jgi:hypothetical protein
MTTKINWSSQGCKEDEALTVFASKISHYQKALATPDQLCLLPFLLVSSVNLGQENNPPTFSQTEVCLKGEQK